jgi:hypothetical protein
MSTAAENKTLWIALGVVAAVALIVIIAVSMSGGGDESGSGSSSDSGSSTTLGGGEPAYTAANEQAFMDACTEGGSEAMCSCAWTEITETIPFDRFAEMEATLEADQSAQIDELTTIMTECQAAT